MSDSGSSSSPFGCMGCVVSLLLLGAIFFGLATPWGTLEIDFFPPSIRLDDTAPVDSGVAPVESGK